MDSQGGYGVLEGLHVYRSSFLGRSFTGHVALLLRHQRQDSSIKTASLATKSPAAYWLKSSTLATLSLGVKGIEHLLTVYIRDQAIIQCSSLFCTLLSPHESGHGWLLVGAPVWAHQDQAQAFVFDFAPADAGRHCQKAMENLRQEQARIQHSAVLLPSATVAAPHATPSTGCKAYAPPAPPRGIHKDPFGITGDQQQQMMGDECSMHSEEELVNLIKGYLQDPGFQEEVDRLEQLLERAEGELLAEAGLDGDN